MILQNHISITKKISKNTLRVIIICNLAVNDVFLKDPLKKAFSFMKKEKGNFSLIFKKSILINLIKHFQKKLFNNTTKNFKNQ